LRTRPYVKAVKTPDTGEVIGARWDEIDFTERLWIIPAERMNMEREHRMPLADASMAILEKLRQSRGGDFIFPGRAG
jgi:integrase